MPLVLAMIWPLSLIPGSPAGIRLLMSCCTPLLMIWLLPTITSLSLTAYIKTLLPRSIIVPFLYKNPCWAKVLVWPKPTTSPWLLIAVAAKYGPPRVGSTVGVPLVHTTPCELPAKSPQAPRTWPLLLIAMVPVQSRLGGFGSAVKVPLLSTQGTEPLPQAPAIWPESLIPDG